MRTLRKTMLSFILATSAIILTTVAPTAQALLHLRLLILL